MVQQVPTAGLVLIFASLFACIYVAGRLWVTTRELHYLVSSHASFARHRASWQVHLALRRMQVSELQQCIVQVSCCSSNSFVCRADGPDPP